MAMGLIYCDPIIINFILQNVRSDITNIFESKNFNVQKISQLSKEGYIIKKQVPGIYYVNGLLVPTQIVVTNQLNSQNHESLKVLSKSAQTDDIQRFTDLIRKPRPFRGDFVMWLEIILIFPFFVFRKTEMF